MKAEATLWLPDIRQLARGLGRAYSALPWETNEPCEVPWE